MLPNELPTPPDIPGSYRLQREVARAIDYARNVSQHSPDSTTAVDLRNFLRAAALLLPSGKTTKKEPQ
jgi:hypothetical protein